MWKLLIESAGGKFLNAEKQKEQADIIIETEEAFKEQFAALQEKASL